MRRRGRSTAVRIVPLGVLGVCPRLGPFRRAVDPGDAYRAPAFAEPVTLSSEDGVLEVSLFARQGAATLDTVATPVSNFLLFGYELMRGTASNGAAQRRQSVPGPDAAGGPRARR